jgi:hypothetical protein
MQKITPNKQSKKKILLTLLMILFVTLNSIAQNGFIVDHTTTNINDIPNPWITQAKSQLQIAYNHTSHGSQLISGMNALETFPEFNDLYHWTDNSQPNTETLSLDDKGIGGVSDLSNGDYDSDADGIAVFAEDTYDFLDNTDNYHINVILWSWCNIGGHDIPLYLNSMEWLISLFSEGGSHPRAVDYPVQFVFITGHANGGGEADSSDIANEQIRSHVQNNNRILFDFSDIENYDPDNNYYLDKRIDDALYYDATPPYDSGTRDANWASEYLTLHDGSQLDQLTTGEGVSGYTGCGSCAHSPEGGETSDAKLNCILKGSAVWYLFARLSGWNGSLSTNTIQNQEATYLYQNSKNPFNEETIIKYRLSKDSILSIVIYDILGNKVTTLVNQKKQLKGIHQVTFRAKLFPEGIYIYSLTTKNKRISRKMLLIK